jgi:plasmid stabilization system protein ParE
VSRDLRIVERARADVDDIFDWLVHCSVQGAISWYLAFGRAVEKIAAAPETFAEAPESHLLNRPLRQALFKTGAVECTASCLNFLTPRSCCCECAVLGKLG